MLFSLVGVTFFSEILVPVCQTILYEKSQDHNNKWSCNVNSTSE